MRNLFLLMSLVLALTCIAGASELQPGPGAPCINLKVSCAPGTAPSFTTQVADPSFTFTLADPSVTNLGISSAVARATGNRSVIGIAAK